MTVATEPYFAPNEFIDPTKTGDEMYVGSDIEFAKYIGEKLGVEVKIVPLEFTEVLTSVQQGKYDIAISRTFLYGRQGRGYEPFKILLQIRGQQGLRYGSEKIRRRQIHNGGKLRRRNADCSKGFNAGNIYRRTNSFLQRT